MISKKEFQILVKEKLLWPGWNWSLKDTIDGIQNTVNEELDSLVEILIDHVYNNYLHTENWVDIFDLDVSDSNKEIVGIPCSSHTFVETDLIRIAGTLNYDGEYRVVSVDNSIFYINNSFKPETFRVKLTCPTCGYYLIPDTVDLDKPTYCPICTNRNPNQTNLVNYDPPRVYKVSEDRYIESDPIELNLGYSVINSPVASDPKFLPELGYNVGYVYDPKLSIAKNRKFIKSVVEVYKIKGTILSIKRIMRLLGHECRVIEPYKQIFKYNASKYSSGQKYSDWEYYHHGVFEIETEGVPIKDYKDVIASTVQPVGTRLVGRNNVSFPLIPMVPPDELIKHLFKSIYTESVIQLKKSGDIYDSLSSRKSRSGNLEVSGFYISKGLELFAQAFRRVFDSIIFSLADLASFDIITTPAARYSLLTGPYSGSSRRTVWNETKYNELSPLDLQLPFSLHDYQSRLPGRSDHGVRSGKFSLSGVSGDGWDKTRYWIQNYGPIVEFNSLEDNFAELGLERIIYTPLTVNLTKPGRILSVDRVLSSNRRIYGFELITQWLFKGITDWVNKLHYMYDDESRRIEAYTSEYDFVKSGFDREKHLNPVLVKRPTRFAHDKYSRSGRRNLYGEKELDISVVNSGGGAISIATDEALRFTTETYTYRAMRALALDENYKSDTFGHDICLFPLLTGHVKGGLSTKESKRSSKRFGSFSGGRTQNHITSTVENELDIHLVDSDGGAISSFIDDVLNFTVETIIHNSVMEVIALGVDYKSDTFGHDIHSIPLVTGKIIGGLSTKRNKLSSKDSCPLSGGRTQNLIVSYSENELDIQIPLLIGGIKVDVSFDSTPWGQSTKENKRSSKNSYPLSGMKNRNILANEFEVLLKDNEFGRSTLDGKRSSKTSYPFSGRVV